jgi:uncharacterized membrane protein YraQ (UPF0718 family)
MTNHKGQSKGFFLKMVLGGFSLFVGISFLIEFDPGRQIGQTFFTMAVDMLKILPVAFVLIGLFEVWVKQETVKNHLGETAGLTGHFWAVLLAGIVVGPLYVSFPVAYAIMQKGARLGVVFTYIGASAICRIPMAIFEASFLGIKFTVIRLIVSLPLVLITSIALEKLMGKRQWDVSKQDQL